VEAHDLVERYALDLYYTTHFPLTEKYIALYPKSEIESQEVLDKRDRIRKELQEEMLSGKKKVGMKQGSGSNKLELGSRKPIPKELEDTIEDDMDDDEDEESEDDEFLDLGHKKR
jgi:hypothetical protein